jgi:hypothetical protein
MKIWADISYALADQAGRKAARGCGVGCAVVPVGGLKRDRHWLGFAVVSRRQKKNGPDREGVKPGPSVVCLISTASLAMPIASMPPRFSIKMGIRKGGQKWEAQKA